RTLIADIEGVAADLEPAPGDDHAAIKSRLRGAVAALSAAVDSTRTTGPNDINAEHCSPTPVLHLISHLSAGCQMARSALTAQNNLAAGEYAPSFDLAKIATARCFVAHVLCRAAALSDTTMHAGAGVMALSEEQF